MDKMSASVPGRSSGSLPREKLDAPPSPLRQQLQMIWPTARLKRPPARPMPEGYELRTYQESDAAGHAALMSAAGFTAWSEEKIREALPGCLPGGFFVVVHAASGRLIATAMARRGFFVVVHAVALTAIRRVVATDSALQGPSETHPAGAELGWAAGNPLHNCPIENHPAGGELGWVAADPGHRGKGLGGCVSAAATQRLLEAGYSDIFLRTDDFRLAAIETYLALGYVPLLFAPDMAARWAEVFRQLGMTFPRQPKESASR